MTSVIDRRGFISGIIFGLLAAPLAAEAQPAGMPRVGVLSPTTADNPLMKAFEQ